MLIQSKIKVQYLIKKNDIVIVSLKTWKLTNLKGNGTTTKIDFGLS